MKKLLSLVLCLTICITLCPANIFAEGVVEGIAEQSGDEYTVEYDEDPDILSDVIDYGDMISSEIPAVFGQESADLNTQAEPEMPEEGQCEEPVVEEVPSESSDPDSAVASGECGENIIWRLDKDGTLTFTGTGAIPDYLLKDNLMGAYYTSAPWGETHRFDIKKIVIGDGITRIGNTAFCGCYMLEEISMPVSLTEIGDWAFAYTGIGSISIPENVTTVGRYVFYQCDNLKEVTIPDSVTGIGNEAFSGCVSLVRINVGEGNTNYRSIDGVLFNKSATKLIIYPRQHGTEYTIPSGVTGIDDGTFSNCASLTTVEIPDSVTVIGNDAFSNCTSLTTVEIPDSVTSIGDYAFLGCRGLTGIEIPNSVTSIGFSAFCNCSNMSVAVLPESLTNIGDWAFSECIGLIDIEIPFGVTSIGVDTFFKCINLRSVTIPFSVTYIAGCAFTGCLNLTDVNYSGTMSQWDAIAIADGNDFLTKATLHCADEQPRLTLSGPSSLRESEIGIYTVTIDGINDPASMPISWSVSNPDIAYISSIENNNTVHLTATNQGTVELTAQIDGGYMVWLTVHVCPPAEAFTLSNTVIELVQGHSMQLHAYFNGSDVSSEVVWNYSPYTVIEVINGYVSTVNRGSAWIMAVYNTGEIIYTAECLVTVVAEAFVHTITLGNNGVFDGTNPLCFTTNDLYENFTGVSVDGIALTEGTQFIEGISSAGNILVSLNPEYLRALSPSEPHIIKIASVNGTAEGSFTCIPHGASTLIITKDLPASYTASENEIVTLSIEACGGNGTLSFQWYSSRGSLTCTSPSITFLLSAPEVIWCVVTSGEQRVESTHCQLITVPESTPKFIVSDSGGNPGKTAHVKVSIENNPGIVGLTVGFVYDSSLFTLRTITPAGLSGSWETGKKVTWASDRGDQFFNGTILDLEFEIADNAPLGTYPIGVSFNKGDICNDAVQPVGFTASSGSITVNSHIPGDVNGDGHVGTKDFITLMQYCADKEGIVYDPNALDINNDGYVNTMDFITLMQYLAGKDIKIY